MMSRLVQALAATIKCVGIRIFNAKIAIDDVLMAVHSVGAEFGGCLIVKMYG